MEKPSDSDILDTFYVEEKLEVTIVNRRYFDQMLQFRLIFFIKSYIRYLYYYVTCFMVHAVA